MEKRMFHEVGTGVNYGVYMTYRWLTGAERIEKTVEATRYITANYTGSAIGIHPFIPC